MRGYPSEATRNQLFWPPHKFHMKTLAKNDVTNKRNDLHCEYCSNEFINAACKGICSKPVPMVFEQKVSKLKKQCTWIEPTTTTTTTTDDEEDEDEEVEGDEEDEDEEDEKDDEEEEQEEEQEEEEEEEEGKRKKKKKQ